MVLSAWCPSDTQDWECAPRFLENLLTPALEDSGLLGCQAEQQVTDLSVLKEHTAFSSKVKGSLHVIHHKPVSFVTMFVPESWYESLFSSFDGLSMSYWKCSDYEATCMSDKTLGD